MLKKQGLSHDIFPELYVRKFFLNILVYEYISAAGRYLLDVSESEFASLLDEGIAMRNCAASFYRNKSDEITFLQDSQIHLKSDLVARTFTVQNAEDHEHQLRNAITETDAVLLIAPEIDGELLRIVRIAESLNANLLSPDSQFVELASDKLRTFEYLDSNGIQTIPTFVDIGKAIEFGTTNECRDWILKPRFGAGSVAMKRLYKRADEIDSIPEEFVLQPFRSGLACSVSVIVETRFFTVLPPTKQLLNDSFEYSGCELIQDDQTANQLEKHIQFVVSKLPKTIGYVGFDLIFDQESQEILVVEINPRFTSSCLKVLDTSGRCSVD